MAGFRKFGATGKPLTCLWCGQRLRKEYFTIYRVGGQPAPMVGDEYYGKKIVEIYKESAVPQFKSGAYRVWLGQYGPYGDNSFCSQGCGYQFGARMAALGQRLKGGSDGG